MKKKNEELKNERFSKLSLRLEGQETLKIPLSVDPHAEKFSIVSNDHGHTHKCDYMGKFGPKYQNC